MTWKRAAGTLSAAMTAQMALANGGTVNIYTGTQPTDPSDSASGTLLGTVTLAATAFTETGGVATAGTITDGTVLASGDAGWFRMFKADGTTVVADGTCAVSGAEMNFADGVSFVEGGTIHVSSFPWTSPES